jgi:ATP-dependent protease Clp ATPase subunit
MNESKSLFCSFCCVEEHKTLKLITGPGAYICDQCVMSGILSLIYGSKQSEPYIRADAVHSYCCFCGKHEGEVRTLITGYDEILCKGTMICNECLFVCVDTFIDYRIEQIEQPRVLRMIN